MRSIRIASALLKIPRLFVSLILFPLLVGLLLVVAQLVLTSMAFMVSTRSSDDLQRTFKEQNENNIVRRIIYGSGKRLPELLICRWQQQPNPINGEVVEAPPNEACHPSLLDAALLVEDPARTDIERYRALFNGNVERLHVCRSCEPYITIDLRGAKPATKIQSIWALAITSLLSLDDTLNRRFVDTIQRKEEIRSLLGARSLSLSGVGQPLNLNALRGVLVLVLNIVCLVIIALWLALKAHRRVLDYFARNGALLPMVAATGKGSFYSALWVLTGVRVFCFLAIGIPLAAMTLSDLLTRRELEQFLATDLRLLLLWIVAIATSLALATLVASIADLKHRHSWLSFLYRYFPLLLCLGGALLWGATFLFEGAVSSAVRDGITACPVVGMLPVLLVPLLKPSILLVTLHACSSAAALAVLLRHNTRWFAAHLEEL